MSTNFWGEDLLWPIAPPGPRDPDFDTKIERAFKALHDIIPDRYTAYYYGVILDTRLFDIFMGIDDEYVWRYWAPTLPKEIVTQEQLDSVLTAIILLLRAVDDHIEHGNASENMKRIASHWHNVLLISTAWEPELTLVREQLFTFVFPWDWITYA